MGLQYERWEGGKQTKNQLQLHSLCSLMSTILLSVTVTLMTLILTVAVHVYCPASEVLVGLNVRVTVLSVLTGGTLMAFRAVSPPGQTACLVHTMSGWTINPSTTITTHERMMVEPGDMSPLEVVITVGGGRAIYRKMVYYYD